MAELFKSTLSAGHAGVYSLLASLNNSNNLFTYTARVSNFIFLHVNHSN